MTDGHKEHLLWLFTVVVVMGLFLVIIVVASNIENEKECVVKRCDFECVKIKKSSD